MLWAALSGLGAGWVLGFLGAGGTVVALPVLLYFTHARPHLVLGTNAAGVAVIASALCIWRVRSGEVVLRESLLFALPGLIGIYLGTRLGLRFPGEHLIFLLGIAVFAIAGLIYYLSTQKPRSSVPLVPAGTSTPLRRRALRLVPTALGVGFVAGFFAIGGGFMIVPGLMLAGDLPLAGGAAGIWLNRRLPLRTLQRAFALLLVLIGIYMLLR